MEHSLRKLDLLIDDVVRQVPFYKPFMNEIQDCISPIEKLRSLPIIEKKTIIDNSESFFSDRVLSRDHLIKEVTTGSSGLPIECYKTKEERFQLAIAAWKQRRAINPRVNQSNMFCLLHAHESQKKVVEDPRNLHPDNISKVLNYLRDEFKPLIIHGSPSDLHEYSKYIRDTGLPLHDWKLGFIETNSEILTSEQKEAISSSFQTKVINNYGCREVWNIAYECSEGNLHLSDGVFVEVIDLETGFPLPIDCQEPGEIIITSLLLKHYPFLRYKIGDIGTLTSKKCQCGLTNPILNLFEARKINLIHKLQHQDKLINGVSLFKGVVQDLVLSGCSEIERYKVIQIDSDTFEVYLILNQELSEQLKTSFQQLAQKRLGQQATFQFYQITEDHPVFKGKNYSFISRVN